MNNTLISICGPTASGKSALGIAFAKIFHTEILSCDSRQFYREMSIGTAVPSTAELAEVKHHFIQDRSVTNPLTAGSYSREARERLKQLFLTKDYMVIVGGSALYENALIDGIDNFPEITLNVKATAQSIFDKDGLNGLAEFLRKQDPETYAKIDLDNSRRLFRAVEVCLQDGKPYSSYLGKNGSPLPYRVIRIGIEIDRGLLYDKINARVDQMMLKGLVEEARNLYDFRHLKPLQTVGYSELFQYFDKKISLERAVELIKQNSRRYAKRQMTFYRKMPDIKWFDYEKPVVEIISELGI